MYEKRRGYYRDSGEEDVKIGKADRKNRSREDRHKVRNILDRVAKGQINIEDIEDLDDF